MQTVFDIAKCVHSPRSGGRSGLEHRGFAGPEGDAHEGQGIRERGQGLGVRGNPTKEVPEGRGCARSGRSPLPASGAGTRPQSCAGPRFGLVQSRAIGARIPQQHPAQGHDGLVRVVPESSSMAHFRPLRHPSYHRTRSGAQTVSESSSRCRSEGRCSPLSRWRPVQPGVRGCDRAYSAESKRRCTTATTTHSAAQTGQHLPRPASERFVAPHPLRMVPGRRHQDRKEGQRPDALRSRNLKRATSA